MSKIVVLGASGLLGSSLVPYLRRYGFLVFCFSSKSVDDESIVVDYTDPNSLAQALDLIEPDFIINLVALTNVDLCEENPEHAFQVNAQTVDNIRKYMLSDDTSHLIHISTDQVYDGTLPSQEDDIKLKNYYSYSKFIAECFAADVKSTIIRTNFFGKSATKNRASFTDWIFATLSKNNKIDAFDDVFFSPISLKTLCYFVKIIIENPITGTFNVGSENGFSKSKFIFTFASLFEFDTKNITISSSINKNLVANRPNDMRMDCSKFCEAYGIRKMPSLYDEIRSIKGEYSNGS